MAVGKQKVSRWREDLCVDRWDGRAVFLLLVE